MKVMMLCPPDVIRSMTVCKSCKMPMIVQSHVLIIADMHINTDALV